jgi:hypothetical protein
MYTIKPAFLLGLLLLLACEKEKSLERPYIPCTYAPYTTGSTYTYEYSSGNGLFNYTVTVTGDTTMLGRHFSILTDGYTNQYIGCNGGQYYLFEKGVSLPDYETPDGVRIFLYDNRPIGSKWVDTIRVKLSGVEQKGLLQYTILDENLDMTILGQEYKDVMVIKQEAGLLTDNNILPLGEIATYYYASGIGYISIIGADYTISLRSYNIK